MHNQQLVSIITPLYNGERFVRQTIESVLQQTYQHWEMIIVNDGSRDNSPAIVENYVKQDSRITLYHQANQGSASARNNAISRAKGRYIAFLDSDDLWDATFLEEQLRFMSETKAAIVCASCIHSSAVAGTVHNEGINTGIIYVSLCSGIAEFVGQVIC